ncbi:MAG: hypothetical protein GY950_32225, partial [bacterium]|nr:hypothetical protein [bacterium]
TPPPTTTPVDMADAMKKVQDFTGKIKERSQQIHGKEISALDKETLLAALPAVDNWEMMNPAYHKRSFGQLELAHLNVTYHSTLTGSGQDKITVNITDTATASAALQPWRIIFSLNFMRDDERTYQKVTTYNNIPVIEKYDKKRKRSVFTFIFKDRYLVELKSMGEKSLERLKQFVKRFDLSKLE